MVRARVNADSVQDRRLRAIVTQHFDFAWRNLQRLGVVDADLQDAAQGVFAIVADKLPAIAEGSEKSFIFGTALRVASHARRRRNNRREVSLEGAKGVWDAAVDPEEALQRVQAVEQLAQILDTMDEPIRATFVLFELEQLTMAEIAGLQRIPPGTVASRLRRARDQFQAAVSALQAESEAP